MDGFELNEATGRYVKIGGRTHKLLVSARKKAAEENMPSEISELEHELSSDEEEEEKEQSLPSYFETFCQRVYNIIHDQDKVLEEMRKLSMFELKKIIAECYF